MSTPVFRTRTVCLISWTAVLMMFRPLLADAGEGMEIRKVENGRFEYADDFQSPRFLIDGFVSGYRPEVWTPGQIRNRGPSGWSLMYRFYGQRVIQGVEVEVQQSANGPNLGGHNDVYVSGNGLDWHHAAGSGAIEAGGAGWQNGPLVVSNKHAKAVLGHKELWLRIDLRNTSGLATNTSSSISSLRVALTLGEPANAAVDPQAELRRKWGELRRASEWRDIALDTADPVGQRPPYYYEDVDGWLRAPGEQVHFALDESQGLHVRRAEGAQKRLPLSLVAFVRAGEAAQELMARITIEANRDASREMTVWWNGKAVGRFDAANYFEEDKTFFVLLRLAKKRLHELRIAGNDGRSVRVRRITIAGDSRERPRWANKPAPPRGGKLQVVSAYYQPDPPPPPASQAVEGRNPKQDVGLTLKHLQRMYKEHTDFGGIRVVLRNDGDAAVRIGDRIELNGQRLEDHYVDFSSSPWDARGVVWYRIRPRLIQPGHCAQAYIRFRRRPAGRSGELSIDIENNEPVNVTVPYVDVGVSIDYVTTNANGNVLYVYARKSNDANPGRVTALTLNGRRLADAKIYGAAFPGHIALLTGRLDRPLVPGEFHAAGIETDAGVSVAAQFRVLPWFYPRSSIHVPPDICDAMNMNLVMWNQRPLAECERYDIGTTAHDPFGAHRRVRFIMGPDEPDAHDNRGAGFDRGLGATARRLAHGGWQQLIERFAPQAASWIIINGTTRPLNWAVYGQMADITCFDPYPVNFYAADHAYVRESLLLARQCGAPNRMYACVEAFGWASGQGVPRGARGPTPDEYRQNVVQAIGSGVKGLTSWVYSSNAGGWQLDDACRQEIASVNKLIEHIEGELLLATPIDLASTDGGQVMTGVVSRDGEATESWPKPGVWAGALLSGPDTIVLATVNHIPASKPDPPVFDPARDVTISVALPRYLPNVSASEATEAGIKPIQCRLENGIAKIKIDAIRSGRVFVLRKK